MQNQFILVINILLLLITGCYKNKEIKNNSTLPKDTKTIQTKTNIPDTVVLEESQGYEIKAGITPPEILKPGKPVYTAEMIENKVEGIVNLRILVGTDGLVKKYILFNDLGHGTKQAIYEAMQKMKFIPARNLQREKVPVWINTSIRFKVPNIF